MASFVSTEFELLQTTIASTSFPSTLAATIEPKISSILPSSQPPLSLSFSIPPPTTIVPPSLSETISTATTTTTTTTTSTTEVATTTTLNYNGLNGTDPYAFTTEARYFSLPIVIQVSNKLIYICIYIFTRCWYIHLMFTLRRLIITSSIYLNTF